MMIHLLAWEKVSGLSVAILKLNECCQTNPKNLHFKGYIYYYTFKVYFLSLDHLIRSLLDGEIMPLTHSMYQGVEHRILVLAAPDNLVNWDSSAPYLILSQASFKNIFIVKNIFVNDPCYSPITIRSFEVSSTEALKLQFADKNTICLLKSRISNKSCSEFISVLTYDFSRFIQFYQKPRVH